MNLAYVRVTVMKYDESQILSDSDYEALKSKRDSITSLMNSGTLPEHYVNHLNTQLGQIRTTLKNHHHAKFHSGKGNR